MSIDRTLEGRRRFPRLLCQAAADGYALRTIFLNDCIVSTRIGFPSSVGIHRVRFTVTALAGILMLVVAVGCRSGAENDLVTRELRMQEDQIYAMEDYLSQYQQLLRQCRAENESLKSELAGDGDKRLAPAGPKGSSGPRAPAQPSTPPGVAPPYKPGETPPVPPANDLQLPDVPLLKETTWNNGEASPDASATPVATESVHRDSLLRVAAAEMGEDHADAPCQVEPALAVEEDASPASDQMESADVPTSVRIRGEVVANQPGGGPRLMVDVEPLTQAGRGTSFVGGASLMVLAPSEEGAPRSLARWDFSPEDVQAIVAESHGETGMEFYLELPVETPVDGPVQLWARLVPEGGEKLLTHIDLHLGESGYFSSIPDQAVAIDVGRQCEDPAETQAVGRNRSSRQRKLHVDMNDGSWIVSRPGDENRLGKETQQARGNWRTASQPLPMVVATSGTIVSPRPESRSDETPFAAEEAGVHNDLEAVPRSLEAPAWSPDRAGAPSSADVADYPESRTTALPVPPRWSPNR